MAQRASATDLIRRLNTLKGLRSPLESVWRDCYDFTYPIRGTGLNGETFTPNDVNSKRARLLDSVSTDSARILSSGIMSGLTPASSKWFSLDVYQSSDDERRWLDDSATVLFDNIHSSNFDAAGFEACIDVVCAGWFALYIEENKERGGLSFQLWPIAGVYVSSTRADGLVDTVFRSYKLSAAQAVTEFGDSLSQKTRDRAEKKPDDLIEFLHAIYPRNVSVSNAKLAKNLPFASVHIEVTAKHIVRESGYHEMPVVVPRWMLIPDSAYGIGPVQDALPDIKQLNELKRMELAAADLAVAGMWIAEDDGVLNPRAVKVGPRKIIVANSVDSMKPLLTGSDFNVSFSMAKDLQAAIRKILMADQLQPQDGPAMTATEVHVRVGLIRQLLGPIYGRLQAEYLQPLIDRCFGLAYRAGVFGEAPETLAGRSFHVTYISPLARAQKQEDVTAIERLNANVAQVAQLKPEVLDLLDGDEIVRILSEALGVPEKAIRDQRAVTQAREQRAQEQQAAAQQAQAQEMQQVAGEEIVKQAVGQ